MLQIRIFVAMTKQKQAFVTVFVFIIGVCNNAVFLR